MGGGSFRKGGRGADYLMSKKPKPVRIKMFSSSDLFQISHGCITEDMWQTKYLVRFV